ncbi:MAG: hypothetical protein AB7T86_08105 [Xanthobacteraceae bacterium]
MTAEIKTFEPQSPVPAMRCPRCRRAMRLMTIEPLAASGENKLLFECECGVEYRRPEWPAGDIRSAARN